MDHAAEAQRTDLMTITRHALNEQGQHPESRGDFTILLSHIVLGCKFVASAVNKAGLAKLIGLAGETNIQNVENCSFVSWVDEPLPLTCQHAIKKVWAMYHEANSLRINERIKSGKVEKDLFYENQKLKKSYQTLVADVKKYHEETKKKLLEMNQKKKTEEMEMNKKKLAEEKEQIFDLSRPELEVEIMNLNEVVLQLKD